MSVDPIDSVAPSNAESSLEEHAVRGAVLRVKRDAIIAAANECFFYRGYTNTSLEYIAKRLNLSSKALYYYFPNKKELFFDTLESALGRIRRIINQTDDQGGAGMDKIRSFVCQVVQVGAQKYGPHISDIPPQLQKFERADKIRSEQKAQSTILVGWVRKGMDDGSIRKGDPLALWNMLLGILMWMPHWARKDAGYQIEDNVRLALEATDHILAPRVDHRSTGKLV